MKVSISWLKELVDLNVSLDKLTNIIPMKTIGLKEITDNFIELDMKGYNRADLLSMRGVAREVAATTDSNIKFKDVKISEYALPKTKIVIEDTKLCPVYCIAKIEGLKSGPSPKDWVRKLENCGMRTVNNIADITNLIMLEFGQPMHSFDTDKVRNETLIVRLAKPGETIKTLDEKDRVLDKNDLVIADSEKLLGIAGVMGGKDSEASDNTSTILLEAAIFDPISIRRSTQRHNLYSEASKRFQHGLTKTNLLQAFNAAIKMYQELGGELTAISFTGNLEDKSKDVNLRFEKLVSLTGISISKEEVEEILNKLGFHFISHSIKDAKKVWSVIVPYWRLDINIEEDLIEEVARMYGYDKIPPQELNGALPEKIDQSLQGLIYNLKKALVDEGLTEVQTYSFYSTDILNNIGWAPDHLDALVRIANPISSETEYMRMVVWQNLLEVVAKNIKKYNMDDIAIFEIGKMYSPKNDAIPEEGYDLSIALMNSTDNPIEELYNILQKALEKVGLKIELGDQDRTPIDDMLFHPTRFQHLIIKNQKNGGIAEIHPRIVNKFGVNQRVAIVEISIEKLL